MFQPRLAEVLYEEGSSPEGLELAALPAGRAKRLEWASAVLDPGGLDGTQTVARAELRAIDACVQSVRAQPGATVDLHIYRSCMVGGLALVRGGGGP